MHGGVEARVLSILRDPGPATQDEVGSGFICVENDDGSAELQAVLLKEAGISPFELLPWNAYPWYINRAPKASELDAGGRDDPAAAGAHAEVDGVVLLQGGDADHAWRRLLRLSPTIERDRGLMRAKTSGLTFSGVSGMSIILAGQRGRWRDGDRCHGHTPDPARSAVSRYSR